MSDKIKVTVLQCGRVRLDRSALFKEEGAFYPWCMAGWFRKKECELNVPAFAFLIEHPNGKRVVYDTSWGSAVRKHAVREMALARLVDVPVLPEGACVNERIAQLGYRNEDIDYVVLSHMHVDHAGGVLDMQGAKKFLVSREEYLAAEKGGLTNYRKRMWKGVKFDFIDYKACGLGPYGLAQDLFGDGSVMLVSTPGHTVGHTSVLIRNNGKQLLLAGDCGYARKSWRDGILPGLLRDEEKMLKSLAWVKHFYDTESGVIDVISDHETELDQFVFEV